MYCPEPGGFQVVYKNRRFEKKNEEKEEKGRKYCQEILTWVNAARARAAINRVRLLGHLFSAEYSTKMIQRIPKN